MAEFKTDIQIAQECEMENIRVIAERAGVDEKTTKQKSTTNSSRTMPTNRTAS